MASKSTSKTEQATESKAPAYIAWHVTDAAEGKKGFWTRIGAAWAHKDGEGLSLQIDLIPVSGGRIVLRSPKDEVNKGEGA